MLKSKIILFFIFIFIFISNILFGQKKIVKLTNENTIADTTKSYDSSGIKKPAPRIINVKELSITKSFEPNVIDAKKIYDEPQKEKPVYESKVMNYEEIKINFNQTILNKLELGDVLIFPSKETTKKLFLKLGYGIFDNIIAEGGYSHYNNINQGFDVFFKNRFSSGSIENYADNSYFNNLLKVNSRFVLVNSSMELSAFYNNKMYNFFGYNNKIVNIPIDTTRQLYHEFNINYSFTNKKSIFNEKRAFDFETNLSFTTLFDKFNYNENLLKFNGNTFFNKIKFLRIGLDQKLSFYENSNIKILNRNFVWHTKLYVSKEFLKLINVDLGFGIGATSNSIVTYEKYVIYPYLKVNFKTKAPLFSCYLKVDGSINENFYKNLSDINPYISTRSSNLFFQRSGLKNTVNNWIFEGSFNFLIHKHFSVNLFLQNLQISNQPFFITKSENINNQIVENSFEIIYDEADYSKIALEISMKDFHKFNLILSHNHNFITPKNEKYAWQIPEFESKLILDFPLFKKFYFNITSMLQGRRFAKVPSLTKELISKEIGMVFDIGLYSKYQISNKFSVFIESHIINGPSNFIYYNYPIQQPNILGGIIFHP